MALPFGRRQHGLAINLAIGPSCFVRCRGCYNHFAGTATKGGAVDREELRGFLAAAVGYGLAQVTFSGGDPLSRSDILALLHDSWDLGLFVKVDTVGTALLGRSPLHFFGHGEVPQVPIAEFAKFVNEVGIPIDGSTNGIQKLFREGRAALVQESVALIQKLKATGVVVCVNTVVHRGNIDDLPRLAGVISDLAPIHWQLFEFQPSGPLGSKAAPRFVLEPQDFASAVAGLADRVGPKVRVEAKSDLDRQELYLLVDDAGIAWTPDGHGPQRMVIGHITRDRDTVLERIREHFGEHTSFIGRHRVAG